MNQELKALLITALGVMILTPDSLLITLANQDSFTVTFYRHFSQFIVLTMLALFIMKRKNLPIFQNFLAEFKIIYPVLFFYPLGSLGFVLGTLHNSVASNLVIIAASPLIGAFLSVFFLKSKVSLTNWVTIIGVFLGVAIVMQGDFVRGDFWGSMASVLCAFNLAAFYIYLRAHPKINILLTISLSSLVTALICIPFMNFNVVIPDDSMKIMLFNGMICALSFYLTSVMSKYVSPEETLLLYLLETLFGPLWVWAVVGQLPSQQTLMGGVVVVSMIVIWISLKFKNRHKYPQKVMNE